LDVGTPLVRILASPVHKGRQVRGIQQALWIRST
jgi:hypothetical protein